MTGDPPLPRFICPRCGAVSHHPTDAAEGYCGRCHAFTAEPGRPWSQWDPDQ